MKKLHLQRVPARFQYCDFTSLQGKEQVEMLGEESFSTQQVNLLHSNVHISLLAFCRYRQILKNWTNTLLESW